MLGYTPALCPEATQTCTKHAQGTHNACMPHLRRLHAACTMCVCSVHSACVIACTAHNTCMQCAQCKRNAKATHVRAVCTVGVCVQHGMCTGHTVHTIKSRGVIRCYFLFSLDALPASSNISLLSNSNTAATCTRAPLPKLEEYRQFAG